MASVYIFSFPILHNRNYELKPQSREIDIHSRLLSSQSTMAAITAAVPIIRRSANYEQSLWSFDFIQSLSSKYTGNDYVERSHTLKELVKTMICQNSKAENPLSTLELVDDLQRLGISYHFQDQISNVLQKIYYNHYNTHDKWNNMDMNLKALGFRILKQHGNHVSEEIFRNIKDETRNFKAPLHKDMVGMLNLFEASYLSIDEDSILDEVRDFATDYLKENLKNIDESISPLITHALELPLHLRVPRIEAKWFIEAYAKRSGMNPTLIELAKLDFNMVQAIHLEDLKHSSRWWRTTCWNTKLSFARDRLVENFLWTIGVNFQPRFGHGRRTLTKVFAVITTVDDLYDVYGTLDELEQFTDVICRWDINGIEELPNYMKICFLGLFNLINEIAYKTLTNRDLLIIPYLKKAWAALCKSYLIEARWYHNGHTPTLEEYLNTASVSVSAHVILVHIYFLTSTTSMEETLQSKERFDAIVCYISLILRLVDDLGTSSDEMARGDVPKSIQCYMQESGATEDEARTYIKTLINDTWKKLNKELEAVDSPLPKAFIECATNLTRTALFMYSNGDGHGRPDVSRPHVLSMLFNPI